MTKSRKHLTSRKYPFLKSALSCLPMYPAMLLIGVTLVVLMLLFVSVLSGVTRNGVPWLKFPNTGEVVIPNTPFVSAVGTKLYANGQPYQFTGVNAYNLGGVAGNAGCGNLVADLDGFMTQLRPNSTVRIWAFQGGMATNLTTKKLDWTGLDRVVSAAQKNQIKLIMVLGDQAGTCDDGHWRNIAWYTGGYSQPVNDLGNGLTPLSYTDYVTQVVTRYKDSPVIAIWEPINEPAASDCSSGKGSACYAHQTCFNESAANKALRGFFDVVGGQIKSIDKNHLVSSGVIGNGQCGAVYEDYQVLHQSPGIDVASYHDYGNDTQAMPGDQWNGLQKRLNQMAILGKPLIVGEVGMLARDNTANCMSYATRRDLFKAKLDAQFNAGVAGILPWDATGSSSQFCNYDIVANDPLLSLLRSYPVEMGTFTPRVTPTPVPTPSPTPVVTPSPSPTPSPQPTPVPDTQAPTAPTKLTGTAISSSQITLNWGASTDNRAVIRYDVFRNNNYAGSTGGTSFLNSYLTPGTAYTYFVKGKDAAGNSSGQSNSIGVRTLPN